MKHTDWKISYHRPSTPAQLLSAGYPPLLARLLALRGIETAQAAQSFISPSPSELIDPFLMKDMDKAAQRLRLAVSNGETVAVYGDYDVDGITSTCLVTHWLRSQGLDPVAYIPDRIEEGYGLNTAAIDYLKEKNVTLIVTVDCGITAVSEAAHAKALGIDMIITDHHECPKDTLPQAAAVVNPKRSDCPYPNKELAGVGVAFKLACAAQGDFSLVADTFSDLVAIGTVADVMTLTGENRCLVKMGLSKINSAPSVGVAALLRCCGMEGKRLTAGSIGFSLAPRLNAAGRLGRASTAASLLLARDPDAADALAEKLCDLNRERQAIELSIWQEALEILKGEPPKAPIVLASEAWHQGVIGIAASRLAEEYSVPAIMVCLDGDKGKGSCRSYGGFNLFDALSACSDCLEGFGGHAMAAGLTVRRDKIQEFRLALADYYKNNPPKPQPEVSCDLLISDPRLLSMDSVSRLDELEPFGNGNPKPTMCLLDVTAKDIAPIGGGKHMRLRLSLMGADFDCIYFSHSPAQLGIINGQQVDAAFTPQINEFRGRRCVQLVISALRPHRPQELSCAISGEGAPPWYARRYLPRREDFIAVWRNIKDLAHPLGGTIDDILAYCPPDMPPEMFCICLKVWCELGLMTAGEGGALYGASLAHPGEKVNLDSSQILQYLRNAAKEKG